MCNTNIPHFLAVPVNLVGLVTVLIKIMWNPNFLLLATPQLSKTLAATLSRVIMSFVLHIIHAAVSHLTRPQSSHPCGAFSVSLFSKGDMRSSWHQEESCLPSVAVSSSTSWCSDTNWQAESWLLLASHLYQHFIYQVPYITQSHNLSRQNPGAVAFATEHTGLDHDYYPHPSSTPPEPQGCLQPSYRAKYPGPSCLHEQDCRSRARSKNAHVW